MKRTLVLSAAAVLFTTACQEELKYDPKVLAEFKRAIPSSETVTAPQPNVTTSSSFAPGDPAEFPREIIPIAVVINATIGGLLDGIEAVVATEPTAFNSETKEFLWGPYDDGNTALAGDTVALYIRESGDGVSAWQYEYMLLRGTSTDLGTMEPIIYGAGTPDETNEEYGAGMMLLDAERNFAFEEANNPGHGPLDRGRFVAVFAKGSDAVGETTFVASAFRGFVTADNPTAPPTSIDHFYGGLVGLDGNRLDFVDFEIVGDIDDNLSALETLGTHLAMWNGGAGRAEIEVRNGDVAAGTHIEVAECWNMQINRDYLIMESVDDTSGARTAFAPQEGLQADCAIQSLADVPSLDDLDPALRTALTNAATGGIPNS